MSVNSYHANASSCRCCSLQEHCTCCSHSRCRPRRTTDQMTPASGTSYTIVALGNNVPVAIDNDLSVMSISMKGRASFTCTAHSVRQHGLLSGQSGNQSSSRSSLLIESGEANNDDEIAKRACWCNWSHYSWLLDIIIIDILYTFKAGLQYSAIIPYPLVIGSICLRVYLQQWSCP